MGPFVVEEREREQARFEAREIVHVQQAAACSAQSLLRRSSRRYRQPGLLPQIGPALRPAVNILEFKACVLQVGLE